MVCLGNICRSPLAEGILQSKTTQHSIYVDSAGTAGYHIGSPPDPRSIAVARKNDIDISKQRCRQFEAADFEEFDMIFAMDQSNLADILHLAPNDTARKKVSLLLEVLPGSDIEVPDPYYGGVDGFDHVFDLINRACDQICEDLINL
ncbi:MAG: low molecular weight phosphotyrosine protein phosphatase [Eudoraea sp.]|nr:low molecular weight phosphotyrosine protein phosphatase [Eudoraea sp.]